MHNPVTDLLFPSREIKSLVAERDRPWQELVCKVETTDAESKERMAFILMMARLNNCAGCNTDSYRATQGCLSCAKQTLKRFHGSDAELIGLYKVAKNDLTFYMDTMSAKNK
jgi:hypothetical protein